MKTGSVLLASALAIATATSSASNAVRPDPTGNRAGSSNVIFVKFREGTRGSEMASIHNRVGGSIRYRSRLTGWQAIRLPDGTDAAAAMRRYLSNPGVAGAERGPTYHIVKKPNDLRREQWAFNNVGQVVDNVAGTPDADIDAVEAWDLATGSTDVVVAVLDTGVDRDRGDLSSRLVPGYDFVNDDTKPNDDYGHGTAVASVLGAIGNNDAGMTGLDWKVRIMPVKICDASGRCTSEDLQFGLDFAVSHGADVINLSLACDQNIAPTWGCPGEDSSDPCYSQMFDDAIRAANQQGVVVVEAASNCGSTNDDSTTAYPCAYDSPGNICAGATNSDDGVAPFSNVGPSVVDIGAPGDGILAYDLSPPGGFVLASGTSFSSPIVAGTAALLLSRTAFTPGAVRERIVSGGDPAGVTPFSFEGGRLNAYNTVKDVFLHPLPFSTTLPGDVELLADVNRDGRDDLVTGSAGSGFTVTKLNKTGTSAGQKWSSVDPAGVVLAGDVDGDLRADLILGDAGAGLSVLRSDGTKFLPPESWSDQDPGALNLSGDFDGDSRADVLRNTAVFEVMLSTGSSTGGFGAPALWSNEAAGDFVTAADVNGDGRDDLVSWTNAAPSSLIDVGLSTGASFAASTRWLDAVSPDPNGVLEPAGAGDFDGDGLEDLLAYDSGEGCLVVLRSTGSAFETARPWTCTAAPSNLLTGRADKSSDARADVVMRPTSFSAWVILRSSK